MAVSTRLNTAVFAPIPSASVATATVENPGAFRNILAANLRSDHIKSYTLSKPASSQELAHPASLPPTPRLCVHKITASPRYNRIVRLSAVLLLALSLVACNRASKNNDAVRQGVIDYLAQRGLNVQGMDVSIANLETSGNQADATVSIVPKGGDKAQGMSMKYHLEQRDNKWTVVGKQDAGSSPHGAMPPAAPGAENPHGGGVPPAAPAAGAAPGGAGKMPSPEDLPPAKKQ